MLYSAIRIFLWALALVVALSSYLLLPISIEQLRANYPNVLFWLPDIDVNFVLLCLTIFAFGYLIYLDARRTFSALLNRWVSADEAAQIVYDHLSKDEKRYGGQLIEIINDLDHGETTWEAVASWIIEGIKEGKIIARGNRERRSQVETIPQRVDFPIWDSSGAEKVVEDEHGSRWRVMDVNKKSLKNYLQSICVD